MKQLLGTYSSAQVKYYKTRKLEKSVFFSAVRKTFKDVKFTVDGSAFQTFITLKLLSNASCASRLKQFILMAPSVSGNVFCASLKALRRAVTR